MKTLAKRSLAIILAVFMLFSVMAVGFTSVSAATEFTNDVIYLQTNSQWRSLAEVGTDDEGKDIYARARFAAYFYNENENTSQWASAEAMEDDTITYTVAVPEGDWTNVIFCRMNPTYTENAWNDAEVSDRVWNQTDNLVLSNEYDCFDITDWSMGEWTNYSDKFVYFVNTKGWDQVASYCRSTTSYGGDVWPGKLCKLVDSNLGVYACKPGSYPMVMFNNYDVEECENTTTFDYNEVAGMYIEPKTNMPYDSAEEAWEAANNYVEPSETTTDPTSTEDPLEFSISRIYFDNSVVKWEKVFIYGWANSMGGTYPMTQIEGTDYWYYDMPQPTMAGVTCFLFKDNIDLWNRYSQDVTVVNGCDCYKIEGQDYAEDGKSTSKFSWSAYIGEAPDLPIPTDAPAPEQPEFFPACDPSWTTLFKGLDSLGIDASYDYRAKIAIANGITDYTGTAAQNTLLLEMLKEGSLRNPEYVEPTTAKPVPKEFTLIGNINGVNVGCEDDHKSNPYIFDENGELTVTFYTMSYIYVKTTDQVNWYMFDAYTTETSDTLYLSSHTTMEKMGVPAGTHKFKLLENADGTLSISYETLSAPPTLEPTETVPPVECKEFYLVANDIWAKDDARFAAYFYNYSGESIWVNLAATDEQCIYKTAIPEGDWSHIIVARMNPAYAENDWNTGALTDRVWNQTEGMSLNKSLNTLTLDTKEFTGEWSYTQEAVPPTAPTTETVPKVTVPNLAKRYALIGYINGEDAGIGEDNVNVPYKFDKKGSLLITITESSYVMVKTTNNEEWYGFEKYCTSTKGTLVLKGPEKMYVPAGSYVFTLKENEDDTLTISYNPVTVISTDPTTTEPTQSDEPAKLTVKKSLKAGQTITAKVENAGGKKVTYKTADKDIVKVNKNTGKITALKKGTATIKAKVGDVTLKKTIKVTSDPKIKRGKSTLSNNAKVKVAKDKKITLVITGKASSVDSKVALENKKIGKITSKADQDKIVIKAKKKGTTKLTVTINNSKKYTFTVKVK